MTLKGLVFLFIANFGSLTWASIGGISGGGGNVISPVPPRSPQSPELIDRIVESSKPTLVKYLKFKESQFINKQIDSVTLPLWAKLFAPVVNPSPANPNPPRNIFAKLNSVGIFTNDDGPCFNSFRSPVDGSIFSKRPNTICISSFTIAQKVDQSQVLIQAVALMIHEYSEVAGLDDDEAIVLQRQALGELYAMAGYRNQ